MLYCTVICTVQFTLKCYRLYRVTHALTAAVDKAKLTRLHLILLCHKLWAAAIQLLTSQQVIEPNVAQNSESDWKYDVTDRVSKILNVAYCRRLITELQI